MTEPPWAEEDEERSQRSRASAGRISGSEITYATRNGKTKPVISDLQHERSFASGSHRTSRSGETTRGSCSRFHGDENGRQLGKGDAETERPNDISTSESTPSIMEPNHPRHPASVVPQRGGQEKKSSSGKGKTKGPDPTSSKKAPPTKASPSKEASAKSGKKSGPAPPPEKKPGTPMKKSEGIPSKNIPEPVKKSADPGKKSGDSGKKPGQPLRKSAELPPGKASEPARKSKDPTSKMSDISKPGGDASKKSAIPMDETAKKSVKDSGGVRRKSKDSAEVPRGQAPTPPKKKKGLLKKGVKRDEMKQSVNWFNLFGMSTFSIVSLISGLYITIRRGSERKTLGELLPNLGPMIWFVLSSGIGSLKAYVHGLKLGCPTTKVFLQYLAWLAVSIALPMLVATAFGMYGYFLYIPIILLTSILPIGTLAYFGKDDKNWQFIWTAMAVCMNLLALFGLGIRECNIYFIAAPPLLAALRFFGPSIMPKNGGLFYLLFAGLQVILLLGFLHGWPACELGWAGAGAPGPGAPPGTSGPGWPDDERPGVPGGPRRTTDRGGPREPERAPGRGPGHPGRGGPDVDDEDSEREDEESLEPGESDDRSPVWPDDRYPPEEGGVFEQITGISINSEAHGEHKGPLGDSGWYPSFMGGTGKILLPFIPVPFIP